MNVNTIRRVLLPPVNYTTQEISKDQLEKQVKKLHLQGLPIGKTDFIKLLQLKPGVRGMGLKNFGNISNYSDDEEEDEEEEEEEESKGSKKGKKGVKKGDKKGEKKDLLIYQVVSKLGETDNSAFFEIMMMPSNEKAVLIKSKK